MFESLLEEVLNNLPDPFVFSYFCGIFILMFFAEERLDAPLRGGRWRDRLAGEGTAHFADFIHKLPPSSLRVKRYYWSAWLIYCFGLVLMFTVLCFVVALAVNTASPEQVGLNKALTIAPGAEAAKVGNTLADTAGQIFPVSTIAPDHPWQPILIAMAMSGVLPIVPRLRAMEQRIRRLSLRTAGIPSQVFRLWEGLSKTKLDFDNTMAALESRYDTGVYQSADRYFQMLGGARESRNAEFRQALAVIAGFRAWTDEPERFPSPEVRRIFDSSAPRNLETDVGFLMDDIAYQVSLSDALLEQSAGNNVARAKETLSARWGELADKTIAEAAVCILLISLYVERAPSLNGSEDKTELLRDWVHRARESMSAGSESVNYFMFSALFALFGSGLLLYFGVYTAGVEWFTDMKYIEASDGAAWTTSTAMFEFKNVAWSALFLFLPAAMPLFMFREVWVREARWKYWVNFFEPPLLQYVLFFVTSVAMSAIFQMLYLYIEPAIVPGSQRALPRVAEFITLSTLEAACFRGLSGGMLATVIASALDQRFREDTWYWPNWSIIILFTAISMPMTLSVLPGFNFVWWDEARRAAEEVSDFMLFDAYLNTLIMSGMAVILLVMMTIYAWHKLRLTTRALAQQQQGVQLA